MNGNLRRQIGREEFDYTALMASLSGYAKPHDRITHLLRTNEILRVKKGLYIFGEDQRRRPYSRELLANLIHGPSFVSLDYALSYHGLVPERVAQVTSVTPGRPCRFLTPVGTFVYRTVPPASFHLGMTLVQVQEVSFLMASPERALADKVREDRTARIRSLGDAEQYLLEDLRLNRAGLLALRPDLLLQLARALGSRKAVLCATLVDKLRRRS
jgi:hypothetical protein